MSKEDFAALAKDVFAGVALAKKGVTTSFALTKDQIAAAFPDAAKLSVPTWSQPRRGSFQKAWKTGTQGVSLESAEGKYSTGTSTLTLKFSARVAGGGCYGGDSFMRMFVASDY